MNENTSLSHSQEIKRSRQQEKHQTRAALMGISMNWIENTAQSFDKLIEFLNTPDNIKNLSAKRLYEWAQSHDIAPIALEMGYKSLVSNGCLTSTIEIYELWVRYSIEYAGEDEALQHIEEVLGCKTTEATDSAKIAVFTKSREKQP